MAAAAADSIKRIKAEATCFICLGLLRDPVTTACGHSFCEPCITRLCQGREDATCPQCRQPLQKGTLQRNHELRSIVELFSPQAEEKPAAGNMCKTHQEPLKLFCKEDQVPICLVCMQSQAHRSHTVVPVEEALQEYKGKMAEQLEVIESCCGKLNQFVNQVWKHLPENEREEEYQSMKRVCEKLTTVLQVRTETPGQRSGEPPSQPPASPSPARDVSKETERQRRSGREPSSEREHGRKQASLDPDIHKISSTTGAAQSKVDVERFWSRWVCESLCRAPGKPPAPRAPQREELCSRDVKLFDSPTSPGRSQVSAGEQAGVSPAGQGAAQTESGGDTGRGRRGPGKRKAAAAGAHRGTSPSPPPPKIPKSLPASEMNQQESMRQHLQGIESTYETLQQLVSTGWLHLPQSAREEARQRLKTLTDNIATLLKVDAQQAENRPKDGSSLTPAEGSGGSRTDASSASSEEEGAAMGSGTEAAREGQQHPGSKISKKKRRKIRKHR